MASVADVLNIARHCDGSVLVVHSGDAPRKLVDNSVQMLWRTETPLLGIVLNRADVRGERRDVPNLLQLGPCDDHGPGAGAGVSL